MNCGNCGEKTKRVEGCEIGSCIYCELKLCQDCCDLLQPEKPKIKEVELDMFELE